MLVYVDDLLVTGSNMQLINDLIHALRSDFPITDLGKLHYFLGIEATHNFNGSILLTQKKYIADLLDRTNMTLTKPVKTPMATFTKLSMHLGNLFEDASLYQSIVESLQYLSFTRPDLHFAISKVCQYMHSPRVPH